MSIAIIGAGIHGVTAAFHLAQRGEDVHVFDTRAVAGGPTGQASGVVRSYYTNPFLASVAFESAKILADFDAHVGGDSFFRRTGGLYLHGPDEVEQVVANATMLNRLGITNTVLSRDDLADHHRDINLDGVGIGVWEDGAGVASPGDTATAYAKSARGLGVRFHLGVAVADIEETAHGIRLRLADGARHEADRILLAAGPWTAPLASKLGAKLPLTAERHVVAGVRHSDDGLASVAAHVLIDVVSGYYARPADGNAYWYGPLAATIATDPDDFDHDITEDEFSWLTSRAAARTPARATARPSRSWASLYDVSPDWQPVIGQISERAFVDAGTSGHGFKLAPVLGDYVARLVLGDPDPELAQFSPVRFAVGAALSSGFGAARILG